MSESAKTFLFVGAAAVAVLAAVLTQPALFRAGPTDLRGQPLFLNFKDPLAVADMKIVDYDEGLAKPETMEVKEVEHKGKLRWSIPSRWDYPADATSQVGAAAAGFVGLRILAVQSDSQSDQKIYGVVDPNQAKPGDTGVGTSVTMSDKEGKLLASLVVGKEVPDRANQRYVRKTGEDPTYIVEVNTDPFSTKFENWIERNLLDIKTLDMSQLQIRDYALHETGEGLELSRQRKMDLAYNDMGEPKWKLADDEKFAPDNRLPDGGRWTPVKLGPEEELDAAKLDDMRMALDDLKIVDVMPKPAGLSAALKVSRDFMNSRASQSRDLAERGFIVGQLGDGPPEMYSADGEVRVGMKDGVEYVLRFGDIAGRGSAKKEDKAKAKGKKPAKPEEKDKDKTVGLNRYLLVMAQFDPKLVPPPKLDPLPVWHADPAPGPEEGKPGREAGNMAKTGEKKAVAGGAGVKPGKAGPKQAEAKKDGGNPAKSDEKKPAGKKAEAGKPAAEPKSKKAEAGKPAAEPKKAEKKPAPKTKQQIEAEKKAVAAERDRIDKENKRKQDEYDQSVAAGQKRVAELNARFADWYYVIAEDVYKKIHVSRDEIVKKKEKSKPQDANKGPQAGHAHDDLPSAPLEQLDRLKGEK